MSDCNTRGSPAIYSPLGTNTNGSHQKDIWNYASVIGMIMYLASNAHPEIKFADDNCDRFTHFPRASHEEAVKHIYRYLLLVKGQGLSFQPTQ